MFVSVNLFRFFVAAFALALSVASSNAFVAAASSVAAIVAFAFAVASSSTTCVAEDNFGVVATATTSGVATGLITTGITCCVGLMFSR